MANQIEMLSKDEWRKSKVKLTVYGVQGKTLILEEKTIIIIKKGWLFAAEREKALPLRQISSVEVKKPGALINGFIQFSIAGGKARDSSYKYTGGTLDAVKDENSVVFRGEDNYRKALKIKEYIEKYSENQNTTKIINNTNSNADEILKYKNLLDNGIITQEEFDIKKKQLLGI